MVDAAGWPLLPDPPCSLGGGRVAGAALTAIAVAGCTTPSEPLAAGDREICGLFRISEVEGLALPEGISERRAPRFVTDGGTCTVDGPGGTGVLVITIDHPGSDFEEMASDNRWQRED